MHRLRYSNAHTLQNARRKGCLSNNMILCWPLNGVSRVGKVINGNVTHDGFCATVVASCTLAVVRSYYYVISLFLPAGDKVSKGSIYSETVFVYFD